MPITAFWSIQSATTGFTANIFPYRSRVSLKEAFAVLELCAGKLACTVLRGPGPSNGVWLLGPEQCRGLQDNCGTEKTSWMHQERQQASKDAVPRG